MDDSIGLELEEHVHRSLQEDATEHDLTTQTLRNPSQTVQAELIAQEDGILAGLKLFTLTFRCMTDRIHSIENVTDLQIEKFLSDGKEFSTGQTLVNLKGPASLILPAERVALNYLQQLSGVATKTYRFVETANNYGVRIYDTRKTIPHHRELQKYAVRCGGGYNHRMTLSDAVMIKDNHKMVAGGLSSYLKNLQTNKPVILEIHNVEEIKSIRGIKSDPPDNFDIDILMLDNFSPSRARSVIEQVSLDVTFEVSGGISEKNLEPYCRTGADRLSVGALTHSFDSLDLSLRLSP